MDAQGQVLLRPAGPNEAGASTLALDFTTITKPMIEENTISLAATRSTPLAKLGLNPGEQMRLERLGVTNLAQLERLKGSTGVGTVARLAELNVDRLRSALQSGLPKIAPQPPPPMPFPAQPAPGVNVAPAPFRPSVPVPGAPLKPVAIKLPGMPGRFVRPMQSEPDEATLELDPASRAIELAGHNLLHEAYPPEVRLNGAALEVQELDDDRIVLGLPEGFEAGALEVRFGSQPPQRFALVHARSGAASAQDPWAPNAGGRE
jgi:hypothetical protein